MSLLDFSSTYLQIGIAEDSKKYTPFLFDSTVYQFKRIPYGFRNSLPAFVRSIKLTLGAETEEYVEVYIDDILIYSKSFEEQLIHLDTVIGKLTQAGFTLNIKKCHPCREEVKFLGHRIDRTDESANPERVEAILRIQLRGTVNS
jgi:hypothetical protein